MFFQTLSKVLMVALAFVLQLLGGWDAPLTLLFLLMGLDILSGLTLSLLRKSDKTAQGGFRSGQFFSGLTRKLLMVLLVILGNALDGLLRSTVCRLSVIGFYAANEALSVIENAAVAGVPFPKALLQALEAYQGRMDAPLLPPDKEGADQTHRND
ncbi:MAG: phage holin family protein [Bacillota bacterium]|nr:phage holin family protein [Bacillota bacterium]